MGLRLTEGVDLGRVNALAPDLVNKSAIAELSADGLLAQSGARLMATAKGRPVLNRLLLELVREQSR